MSKINITEHARTIFLYIVVAIVVSVYRLISITISGVAFDLYDYLFKVTLDLVIVSIIFAIGFPDGKREATEKQEFRETAKYFRNHIEYIIKSGLSSTFRKHCEVYNINSLYQEIKDIVEIECGLDLSYLKKSKKELKELVDKEEIDKFRYKKLIKCKNLNVKYSTINANRILLGSTSKNKASYEYNETKNTVKILFPKIIQTMMFPLLFALTLAYNTTIDVYAIINACASLITVLMSIIFSKNAGHQVIEQRRSTFVRWSDFIEDFKTHQLTDNDIKKIEV